MKCYRCGSGTFYEKFYGPHEHFCRWKCIYCGEVFDQVILENRDGFGKLLMVRNRLTRNGSIVRR